MTLPSLSAAKASRIRRLASRYLTIASAVSSDEATTSRSISARSGLAATKPLPTTVKPSILGGWPAGARHLVEELTLGRAARDRRSTVKGKEPRWPAYSWRVCSFEDAESSRAETFVSGAPGGDRR